MAEDKKRKAATNGASADELFLETADFSADEEVAEEDLAEDLMAPSKASSGSGAKASASSSASTSSSTSASASSSAYAAGASAEMAGATATAGKASTSGDSFFEEEEGKETKAAGEGVSGEGTEAGEEGASGEKKSIKEKLAEAGKKHKSRKEKAEERRQKKIARRKARAAAAEQEEDDDRSLSDILGQKRMVWLVVGFIVLVILLIVIIFSDRLYNQMEGNASYVLTKSDTEISFSSAGSVSIRMKGNLLLRCSQDGLQALLPSGNVSWDVPYSMSSPNLVIAGDYLCVADQLGLNMVIVKNGQIEAEIAAESNILINTVNSIGESAVAISATDGHMINLYSLSGDLLMQRRTYSSTDGVPVAVALSDDGTRMATVYVNYTGTTLKSVLTVFDLSESGSLMVDRILGSMTYDEQVISDLKFVGTDCFYAGTKGFGMLSTKDGVETEWTQDIQYEIDGLVMTDEYFAVRFGEGLAGTVVSAYNNVVVYNYNGSVISQQYVADASYINASGDTVIVGSGRSYMGMSTAGSVKWTLDSIEDYVDLLAFNNGRKVAALKSDAITFFDVTLKSVAGTEE